jgi:hypothetical protein
MKRINLNIDDEKHAAFKAKTAAAGLTISDVLNAAIADYMAGKWVPKAEKKAKKPIDK